MDNRNALEIEVRDNGSTNLIVYVQVHKCMCIVEPSHCDIEKDHDKNNFQNVNQIN